VNAPAAIDRPDKEPFDIDRALDGVREAVRPYPPAALFELAEEGYGSLFEALVGCIISIRTRDEDMIVVARRLFAHARTPADVAALPGEEIVALLRGSQFAEPKAGQIQEIARRTVAMGGTLPCDYESLLTLPGVGPKCANLALGIACGADAAPYVAVDVHVHRITNRWGYVSAPTPEKTMAALDGVLPTRYRVEINSLLVPFGKHVCTGTRPRCSTCPVLPMCRQVGVTEHR
jgi:endonuclease-3